MLYKNIVRPVLFTMSRDPEVAHERVLAALSFASRHETILRAIRNRFAVEHPSLERTVMGLHFRNPIGVAAGFDKDHIATPALAALGFGHVEDGTTTGLGQEGNPRQRIYRLAQDEALINRMGFNNPGSPAVAEYLSSHPHLAHVDIPRGVSIGKSKLTSTEDLKAVITDCRTSLAVLYPFGDYFAINVSSPNTPGLRGLQDKQQLRLIIAYLQEWLELRGKKPLLVKIAPDLTWEQINDVIEACLEGGIAGIIATNTTLSRAGLVTPIKEDGGLSGKPLRARALEIVEYIRSKVPSEFAIIGVGGIFTAEHARQMLNAGANLVQVYTGMIYEGPSIARNINKGLITQGR